MKAICTKLLNTEINNNSPSLTQLKKSGFIIKLEPLKRKFVGRADTHRIGFKALAQWFAFILQEPFCCCQHSWMGIPVTQKTKWLLPNFFEANLFWRWVFFQMYFRCSSRSKISLSSYPPSKSSLWAFRSVIASVAASVPRMPITTQWSWWYNAM